MSVTERDKKFAEEYLLDMNASAAARRAGFKPKTAKDAASWIKPHSPKKPQVRDYLDGLIAERSRRTGVTAERVIEELAKIAFVNPADVIDFETGQVRPDARPEDLAAIQSITVKDGKIVEYEVRLADKVDALKQLGMHTGALTENVKINGAVPVIVDDG
jgi:phage terminase small subunit